MALQKRDSSSLFKVTSLKETSFFTSHSNILWWHLKTRFVGSLIDEIDKLRIPCCHNEYCVMYGSLFSGPKNSPLGISISMVQMNLKKNYWHTSGAMQETALIPNKSILWTCVHWDEKVEPPSQVRAAYGVRLPFPHGHRRSIPQGAFPGENDDQERSPFTGSWEVT